MYHDFKNIYIYLNQTNIPYRIRSYINLCPNEKKYTQIRGSCVNITNK